MNVLGVIALIASGVGIVGLLTFPAELAYLLGPVGTLVLLIGCWATMIGMLIVVFGKSGPLALFQVLKLRSTPIVTLLIVVPLAISFVDVPPTLHAIRTTAGGTLAKRQSIQSAFTKWNTKQRGASNHWMFEASPVRGNSPIRESRRSSQSQGKVVLERSG